MLQIKQRKYCDLLHILTFENKKSGMSYAGQFHFKRGVINGKELFFLCIFLMI